MEYSANTVSARPSTADTQWGLTGHGGGGEKTGVKGKTAKGDCTHLGRIGRVVYVLADRRKPSPSSVTRLSVKSAR